LRLRQSGSAWPLDWRSAAGDARLALGVLGQCAFLARRSGHRLAGHSADGRSRVRLAKGDAAAARVQLIVLCKFCGHQSEADPAQQARWYGPETTVPDWRNRLVCSRRGGRQTDMVVTVKRRRDRRRSRLLNWPNSRTPSLMAQGRTRSQTTSATNSFVSLSETSPFRRNNRGEIQGKARECAYDTQQRYFPEWAFHRFQSSLGRRPCRLLQEHLAVSR
jgi:hypothetical protein